MIRTRAWTLLRVLIFNIKNIILTIWLRLSRDTIFKSVHRTTETSRRTSDTRFAANKEQRIFIAAGLSRGWKETAGQGTSVGGKAAGKLRVDENDNASRAHVRRFPPLPPAPLPPLYRQPSPSVESEFHNNRTRKSVREIVRASEREEGREKGGWSAAAVHTISGILGGEGEEVRGRLREGRRIIISRDEDARQAGGRRRWKNRGGPFLRYPSLSCPFPFSLFVAR